MIGKDTVLDKRHAHLSPRRLIVEYAAVQVMVLAKGTNRIVRKLTPDVPHLAQVRPRPAHGETVVLKQAVFKDPLGIYTGIVLVDRIVEISEICKRDVDPRRTPGDLEAVCDQRLWIVRGPIALESNHSIPLSTREKRSLDDEGSARSNESDNGSSFYSQATLLRDDNACTDLCYRASPWPNYVPEQNAAVWFMTYLKLGPNFEMSCGKKEKGVWGK